MFDYAKEMSKFPNVTVAAICIWENALFYI